MSIISAYRTLRNANLPEDFPVVDDINLDAKTVTKMEVLKLTEDEYQNVYIIEAIVKGYIDELSNFNEVKWNNYHFLRGRDFQDRYLEVGIPAGKATRSQIDKLVELQEYAQSKDVNLVINEVP